MEDIDPPREQAGAASSILADLERCGLEWDGEVLYQSTRSDAYVDALERLAEAGLTYACTCSRRDVAEVTGGGPAVYPGTCRDGPGDPTAPPAIRLRVAEARVEFDDHLQGRTAQDLATEVGDFVLRRRDGLFAYQLAVVVDDAAQGITEIVRGTDLIDSTPRQIYLQRMLSLPAPAYCHLPIVVDASGAKLSKQTGAAPVSSMPPSLALVHALEFLDQDPTPGLATAEPREVLAWALEHWDPASLKGCRSRPFPLDAAQ
jgi:glutamyl-Q tRNA(Asp) synthetase